MDVLVDGMLEWTPVTPADIGPLWELTEAIDYLDDAIDPLEWDDLARRFRTAGGSLACDTLVGRDRGGTIVAWAWNRWVPASGARPAVCWLDGGVHPARRHQGIGSRLLAWQVDRAKEWLAAPGGQPAPASLALLRRVDSKVASHGQVLAEAGLVPERWYIDLRTPERSDLPTVAPDAVARSFHSLAGRVHIAPFELARSEEVRALHNDIFSAMGATAVECGSWSASLRLPNARPEWSWIALADDAVVGYALNSVYPPDWETGHTDGWTDRIGVDPTWRGQGIATALLDASQRSFAGAGLTAAGLGLDTRNAESAVEPFLRCGYEIDAQVALYSALLVRSGDGASLRWEAPARLA